MQRVKPEFVEKPSECHQGRLRRHPRGQPVAAVRSRWTDKRGAQEKGLEGRRRFARASGSVRVLVVQWAGDRNRGRVDRGRRKGAEASPQGKANIQEREEAETQSRRTGRRPRDPTGGDLNTAAPSPGRRGGWTAGTARARPRSLQKDLSCWRLGCGLPAPRAVR